MGRNWILLLLSQARSKLPKRRRRVLPVEQPRRKRERERPERGDGSVFGRRFAAGTTKLTQPFINRLGEPLHTTPQRAALTTGRIDRSDLSSEFRCRHSNRFPSQLSRPIARQGITRQLSPTRPNKQSSPVLLVYDSIFIAFDSLHKTPEALPFLTKPCGMQSTLVLLEKMLGIFHFTARFF